MATRLRSRPAGAISEIPNGAPSLWAIGKLIWGKPVNPATHSKRMALLR